MKDRWLRFVLLLDFAGDFEDEDDDENEEDGGSGYFSHRLSRRRPCSGLAWAKHIPVSSTRSQAGSIVGRKRGGLRAFVT